MYWSFRCRLSLDGNACYKNNYSCQDRKDKFSNTGGTLLESGSVKKAEFSAEGRLWKQNTVIDGWGKRIEKNGWLNNISWRVYVTGRFLPCVWRDRRWVLFTPIGFRTQFSTSWVFSALYESMLLYQRFYDNDVCLNHMFYCGYMYKVFKLVCK